jgi:hypothetical protein
MDTLPTLSNSMGQFFAICPEKVSIAMQPWAFVGLYSLALPYILLKAIYSSQNHIIFSNPYIPLRTIYSSQSLACLIFFLKHFISLLMLLIVIHLPYIQL